MYDRAAKRIPKHTAGNILRELDGERPEYTGPDVCLALLMLC